MINNKKAVSPLIATVLLVMIVVSIGAAVMVVIEGISNDQMTSIDQQMQLMDCGTDVNIDLMKIDSRYRICVSDEDNTNANSSFVVLLENSGTKDISGWRFTVIGDQGIYDDINQGAALSRGSIGYYNFTFEDTSTTVGEISKIRLSPQIPGGPSSPYVTCLEPNLEWDAEDIAQLDICDNTTWAGNINN